MRSLRRIIFATTNGWGGSEELWSRAAVDLARRGFPVSASVLIGPAGLHPRFRDLRARGVELWPRPLWYSFRKHPWRRIASLHEEPCAYELDRLIHARPPALAVLSTGGPLPPVEMLEVCATKRVPFITIGQANYIDAWYRDDVAERYRIAVSAALRCCFVSQSNLRLAERQIGAGLPNAEVVWNPVNVSVDWLPQWPQIDNGGEMRFACVGRLHPSSKGQDLLLEVLSEPIWKTRPWRLTFYGEGPMRDGLERLAKEFDLSDRVTFAGFVPVEEIWSANHVLIMPSRYEGLPLATVEAMLCGRPVVATNIAGPPEVVEDGVTGFLADAPTVSAVAVALERFWQRRNEAEAIGGAAARRIRKLMPIDPVRRFSEKLLTWAGLSPGADQ